MSQVNSRNYWLNSFKMKKNHLTLASQNDLIENHHYEQVVLSGLRADGSKKSAKFLKYGMAKRPGMATERMLLSHDDYLRFAAEVQWTGDTAFDGFRDLLGEETREIWDTIKLEGDNWYDPAHPNANNGDGLVRLMEALFITWSQNDSPGEALATRILSYKWKHNNDRGTLWKPADFKQRLKALWRLCEMLPRRGPETTDREKLRAVWDGFTDDAQLYVREELRIDPFDVAGNGADEIDWTDAFDLIAPYWNREYKKIADAYDEKKRRRDDDDDDDNDQSNRSRKKRRGNGKGKNGRRNGGDKNNGDKSNDRDGRGNGKSNFKKQCPFHDHPHLYEDCIFCPTGKHFKKDKATAFYNGPDSPPWYKKTFKRRVLNSNDDGPPQQEQQQQQQQYLIQAPNQPAGIFMAVPAAAPQQQPPTQVAPVFAASTSSATVAPTSGETLYTMKKDASGRTYLSKL